jgi:hypothetical protein
MYFNGFFLFRSRINSEATYLLIGNIYSTHKEKMHCISAYCKRESQLIEKSLLLFFFLSDLG